MAIHVTPDGRHLDTTKGYEPPKEGALTLEQAIEALQRNAHIQHVTRGDIAVVVGTKGKILADIPIARLGFDLCDLPNSNTPTNIVLDLTLTDFISSAMIGKIVLLNKWMKEASGRIDKKLLLRMCGVKPAVMEVFEITRLNKIFKVNDETPEESLEEIRKQMRQAGLSVE